MCGTVVLEHFKMLHKVILYPSIEHLVKDDWVEGFHHILRLRRDTGGAQPYCGPQLERASLSQQCWQALQIA